MRLLSALFQEISQTLRRGNHVEEASTREGVSQETVLKTKLLFFPHPFDDNKFPRKQPSFQYTLGKRYYVSPWKETCLEHCAFKRTLALARARTLSASRILLRPPRQLRFSTAYANVANRRFSQIRIRAYVSIYAPIHLCICIYVYIYVHIIYICIYIRTYVCMSVRNVCANASPECRQTCAFLNNSWPSIYVYMYLCMYMYHVYT